MAKEKERKSLIKEGQNSFMLIGKARVTDKTFDLEHTYDSGWTSNKMYLGIDCGNGNLVYAEMDGGYFPDHPSPVTPWSKDEKDANGKSKRLSIAWEDRLDESYLDLVTSSSKTVVGLEKDVADKTVYKEFLSAYDAVQYASEVLTDGMIVCIRGNLSYSEYNDSTQVRKVITSIALSKAEESDYKSPFNQTIYLDSKCLGKYDSEKNITPISAYVMDYVGNPKINGKKIEVKRNVIFPIKFDYDMGDNLENTAKILKKFFTPKKGTITKLTVTGSIIEGASTVVVTEADIPDDIKELIELGIYTEDEVKAKLAVSGNREKRLVISKPLVSTVSEGDNKTLKIDFEENKYSEEDLIFYEQALNEADATVETVEKEEASSDETEDFLSMLAGM